jgi:hypothetical protein
MTGASKNTITKLLCELGAACRAYHDEHVGGVTSKRVQCNEIWSFVYGKDKNLSAAELIDELIALLPDPTAAAWGSKSGRKSAGQIA